MFNRPTPKPAKIPFTQAAFDQKQAEFSRLTQERKEVLERLKVAREMGDLSENGAYTAAKFELGSISRQLRELRYLLDNGFVAEISDSTETVDFGHTVTLKSDTQELTFMLVSNYESNPVERKLSFQSPIGQAVKGKKVGDTVAVITPKGTITYQVMKIT